MKADTNGVRLPDWRVATQPSFSLEILCQVADWIALDVTLTRSTYCNTVVVDQVNHSQKKKKKKKLTDGSVHAVGLCSLPTKKTAGGTWESPLGVHLASKLPESQYDQTRDVPEQVRSTEAPPHNRRTQRVHCQNLDARHTGHSHRTWVYASITQR